jgi:hypothetical protein
MPRNTNENINNFKNYFMDMVSNNADAFENLDDIKDRPYKVSFIAYDKFKVNMANPKYVKIVQDIILNRAMEINEHYRLNELLTNAKDRQHYTLDEILKFEDMLNDIWDDTNNLLLLSQNLAKHYEKHNPNKERIKSLTYENLKLRTFKLDIFGVKGCNVGWINWERLIKE